MIKENLLNKLIDDNILTTNSEIQARHTVKSIGNLDNIVSDTFSINDIKEKNNKVYILSQRNSDGMIKVLKPSSIISIEGMDIERFAKSYNLKDDGTKLNLGKKRGRKSKAELGLE